MSATKLSSLVLTATALFASATRTSAQTIVNTGDDLVAMVAAASDGDTLEIHSNATFLGTLSWSAKSLTIIAGPGFTPAIKGTAGGPVANLYVSDVHPTKATFKNLTLERGADTTDPFTGQPVIPNAFSFAGSGTSPVFAEAHLDNCTVIGNVLASGTGPFNFVGTFANIDFQDSLILGGTGNLVLSIKVNDCTIAGKLDSGTTGSAQTKLDVHRTRIGNYMELEAIAGSTTIANIESCLIANNGPSTFGVRTGGNIAATFTNVTVSGFATGLIDYAGSQWHNMLLANNTTDLMSVASANIFNSLIEDGTYDGVNGNFAGTALMDPNGNLLACSGGIDAGDNAAPYLGATDLDGAPRIQDNDGDGTATVNVGATEAVGTIAGTATVANGTGINPLDYSPDSTSLPTVGTTFTSNIATPPGTALTIVAFDAPAAVPFLLPGFVGEVQVAVTPTMLLNFANGLHSQPIPLDCALVGLAISAQGFRAMNSGSALVVHCLNSLDLVIGG